MPPYYLTFSGAEQLLWHPICGFLFASQGSGACSIRISWRAKHISEGIWVLLLEGFRALPGGASFNHKTVVFIKVDFIVSALTINVNLFVLSKICHLSFVLKLTDG